MAHLISARVQLLSPGGMENGDALSVGGLEDLACFLAKLCVLSDCLQLPIGERGKLADRVAAIHNRGGRIVETQEALILLPKFNVLHGS